MVFKKFKEDIVEPYAKSKIVITFYSSSSHHFVGEQAEIATQPQIPFTIHNSNGMVTSRC